MWRRWSYCRERERDFRGRERRNYRVRNSQWERFRGEGETLWTGHVEIVRRGRETMGRNCRER